MNRKRRKMMEESVRKLTEIKNDIEAIQEEEQESYDNLPEQFQESEQGIEMDDNIETLSEGLDDLQSCIDRLEDVLNK